MVDMNTQLNLVLLVLNNLTLKEHFEVKRSLDKQWVTYGFEWIAKYGWQKITMGNRIQEIEMSCDRPLPEKLITKITLLPCYWIWQFVYNEHATMTIVVHTMVLDELNEVPGEICLQNMNISCCCFIFSHQVKMIKILFLKMRIAKDDGLLQVLMI